MICCCLSLSFEKILVLSVFPCVGFGGAGTQRAQLSEEVAAKGSQAALPGERGEVTRGREAAVSLLAEAPSYANTGRPPRLIAPACIPGRAIPTFPLLKQPAVIFIPDGAAEQDISQWSQEDWSTKGPHKLGVLQVAIQQLKLAGTRPSLSQGRC